LLVALVAAAFALGIGFASTANAEGPCATSAEFCAPGGDFSYKLASSGGICSWKTTVSWGDGKTSSKTWVGSTTFNHHYDAPHVYNPTFSGTGTGNDEVTCTPFNIQVTVEVPWPNRCEGYPRCVSIVRNPLTGEAEEIDCQLKPGTKLHHDKCFGLHTFLQWLGQAVSSPETYDKGGDDAFQLAGELLQKAPEKCLDFSSSGVTAPAIIEKRLQAVALGCLGAHAGSAVMFGAMGAGSKAIGAVMKGIGGDQKRNSRTAKELAAAGAYQHPVEVKKVKAPKLKKPAPMKAAIGRLNALFARQAKGLALTRALEAALERANDAQVAGDSHWQDNHQVEACGFAGKLAANLRSQRELRIKATKALKSANRKVSKLLGRKAPRGGKKRSFEKLVSKMLRRLKVKGTEKRSLIKSARRVEKRGGSRKLNLATVAKVSSAYAKSEKQLTGDLNAIADC
jgi:hypothetical protein